MTVKDGLGVNKTLASTEDVNNVISLIQTNRSFELACSMGLIPGYSKVDKWGINDEITTASDPEDVWEGGGLYNYDADGTAPIVSLASDNGADTQEIYIEGLDINGVLVTQNITLAGTTRVALTTPLWRVFRMENEGTTNLVGTVFCYTGVGTVPSIGDAEVRAIIDDGNNQTQMAIYTIPAGKVGFLYYGDIAMAFSSGPTGGEFARVTYRSRRFGKVFKIKKTITLTSGGSTIFQDYRRFPDIIPAKTDIRINVQEVSATMGVSASIDLLLINEDQFTPAYLAAIGQPS
jgi:hypothetical protein